MKTLKATQIKAYKNIIIAVSVLIPVVVGALFRIRIPGNLSFLPPIYAGFNGVTAILLIAALISIRRKKIELHRKLIRFSLLLSILFLICYVAYHLTSDPTYFGDSNKDGMLSSYEKAVAGNSRNIYTILLASHIILSMAVVPLVLFAYLNAWAGDFEKHKKIVRFAFPIWLYVAITGVMVYWLISPYYA
ncbi:MAG TPA: DUF420 domain-containing protein [Crocinitomicaceae bacterium]|nr:DUF420 domain-containing protein [Crocinitomicaceae bacterium]